MEHFSAVKFDIGYENNVSFLAWHWNLQKIEKNVSKIGLGSFNSKCSWFVKCPRSVRSPFTVYQTLTDTVQEWIRTASFHPTPSELSNLKLAVYPAI